MKTEKPTTAATVGEGRDIALDHKTAKAIADASQKAGFPIPPTAATVLGTKAVKAAPKRPAAARPKPAAKPKPTTPATPVAAPAVTGAAAADTATKED